MTHHRDPMTIEATRGDLVESRHLVDAVVADADGKLLGTWGDVERHVYPRSAIKPLQALPLIATGAADAYRLGEREIALACASHMGEAIHINTVTRWLEHIDCAVTDLECGAHAPRNEDAYVALIASGESCTAAHNNCSGKHTGFLTTARHLKEQTAGYTGADHPVQQRLAALLTELGGADLSRTERGIDGCGIPTLGMPLTALARAMARMAAPDTLDPPHADAARRIAAAMTTYPEMVRGTGGFDTILMTAGKGRFVTKTGAEGVHIAIVPERRIGVAVKVRDGAGRASEVALMALLDDLGLIDDAVRGRLGPIAEPEIPNAAGRIVGILRTAPGWRD